MDARGIPTTLCPSCGSDLLKVIVKFDPSDYEIGIYFLDGECAKCGTLLTIATAIDYPRGI